MKRVCLLLLFIIGAFSYNLCANVNAAEKQAQQKTPLQQCIMKTYGSPKAGKVKGFNKADCVQIEGGIKICKAIGMKEGEESAFVVEHNGKRLISWSTGSFLGETDDFEALKKDLDGDGKEEIIIASRDNQYCGMVVEDWTIAILDGNSGFEKPLIFRVEDYGIGVFVQHGKSQDCLIMATAWEGMDDTKRGPGLYFVGRFFKYKSGLLEPAKDCPARARRFLNSFRDERGSGNLLKWMNNPKTEILQTEPYLLYLKKIADATGRIEKITKKGISFETSFIIKLDSGVAEEYDYLINPWLDEYECSDKKTICRFGDAKSGIIYPENYIPQNIEQKFTGREVIVTQYSQANDWEENECSIEDSDKAIDTVLWLK